MRTRTGMGALDDWLQAEAEVRLANDPTVETSGGEGSWTNIEPFLKWGAVAYGLGFVTVMLHTRKIGIPVIQLVEPVNIWIGLPLAVVLFFMDKLIARLKRIPDELIKELRVAKKEGEAIKASSSPQQLLDAMLATLGKAYGLFRRLHIWFPKRILEATRQRLKTVLDPAKTPQEQRDTLRNQIGFFVRWLTVIIAVRNAFNIVLYTVLIFAACAFYVWVIYPVLPQTVGGGKPMTVRLIVNTEKVPTDAAGLRDIFPAGISTPQQGTRGDKGAETVPVTLHYQTEHTYYVSKSDNPIIALDHAAVDAIIFGSAAGQ